MTMEEETIRRQVRRRYKEVRQHVVRLINESNVEMKRLEDRLLALTTPPRTNTKTEAAEPIYGTPQEISPRIDQCITDAWGGKKIYVLLSKIGPYKIFFSDIHKTSPGEELESEVINAFMHLEIKKLNARSAERAFYIDSYEMASVWKGHLTKLKIDLSVYHYIIGIINDHSHWTVTVIMPAQQKTLFLDPLGESRVKLKKCQEVTRALMDQTGCDASTWVCETVPHPMQTDSSSCGVFALKFAECILRLQPVEFCSSEASVKKLRRHIAVTLLQNSDDLTLLCFACGEASGVPDWISCLCCLRRYHRSCVQASTLETYVCAACLDRGPALMFRK